MKYSDFEKHIGTELGGAQEAVDVNQLLAGLNLGDLPRKRKLRPFLLWLLIPMILLGSYATFVAMDGDQSFSFAQNENNNQLKNDLKNNQSVPGNDNSKENNNSSESKQNTSNIIAAEESKDLLNTIVTSAVSNQSEDNSTISANELRDKDIADLQINQETKIHSVQSEKNTTLKTSIKKEENLSKTSTVMQPSYTDKSQSELIAGSNKQKLSYFKSTIDNESISKTRPNVMLPNILSRSINIQGLDAKSDDLFSRMKINCPSFNQAFWRLALIPEVGVFSPYKTIVNKRQEDIQAFEERQTYEETLEGINLGLYTMLVRDKLPIYLKAGISYSRITERTDLEYNYTLPDTTIGIISQTVSENGDSITTITGPIISEKTFTGKNRQHNYIHLFDLPVSVGYNSYIGGFDVGIEAGVKINLMTRATGNLLTSKSDYTNLSLNEYFKNRIGLSYFGGIMIGRNFGRLGDFYIAPRFTYYPTDFSNEINQISQKYVTMGLNVGYVYKLK